jgi:hypothetical protein
MSTDEIVENTYQYQGVNSPQNLILNSFRTTLIARFQTGNLLIDSIISMFIVFLVTSTFNWMKKHLMEYWRNLKNFSIFPENQIVLSSAFEYSHHKDYTSDDYPITVLSIFHHMNKSKYIEKVSKMREICLDAVYQKDKLSSTIITYGVNESGSFKIAENIYGRLERKFKELENHEDGYIITLSIHSRKLSITKLQEFVNTCIRNYEEYTLAEGINSQYYFNFTGPLSANNDDDGPKISNRFTQMIFTTNRNFGNIFFDQKEEFVHKINFFNNNREWYNHRGIPYTLGLLFYGTPGCGKTSTIKALANMTKRHIINIDLRRIKNAREFTELFTLDTIKGKIIPMYKRLYVLEDIDCMCDIVKHRGESSDTPPPEITTATATSTTDLTAANQTAATIAASVVGIINSTNPLMRRNKLKMPEMSLTSQNCDQLTLSTILNVLDGVMEMSGRMLIMSTNHPEMLDPALIRPGRIDMKIHFRKCSAMVMKQLIMHFYEMAESEFAEDQYQELLTIEEKWSPAEINEILIRNRDYRDAIDEMVSTNPVEF